MDWSELRAAMQALIDAGTDIPDDLMQTLNDLESGREVERSKLNDIACQLLDAGQDFPDDLLQKFEDLDALDEFGAPLLSGRRPGPDEC